MWSGRFKAGDQVYDLGTGHVQHVLSLWDDGTAWLANLNAKIISGHDERPTSVLIPAWHPYVQTGRVLRLLKEPLKEPIEDLDAILKDPHPDVKLDPAVKESIARAQEHLKQAHEQVKQAQEELKRAVECAHPKHLWGEEKKKADKLAAKWAKEAEEQRKQAERAAPLATVYLPREKKRAERAAPLATVYLPREAPHPPTKDPVPTSSALDMVVQWGQSSIPLFDPDNPNAAPLIQRLFPGLGGIWRKVDLAALHGKAKPIVSDVKAQDELLQKAAETDERSSLPVRTYGGLGEDRDQLWFASGKPQIHLGIDFNNLPPGQSVASLTSGKVLDVMRDKDPVNGWGGRVIVQTEMDRYVLYGHLDHKHLPAVGDMIRPGDEIGRIAEAPENGGWFPHLHLQYMDKDFVEPYIKANTLAALDGYASGSASLPKGILDPMTL